MTLVTPRETAPGREHPDRPGRGRRPRAGAGRELALMVGAAVLAALIALALAPLGSIVVYAIGGLIAAGIALYAVRAEVLPPLRDAVDRARPSRHAQPRAPRPRAVRVAIVTLIVLGIAFLSIAMASHGLLAVIGIVGLIAMAATGWLFWPMVRDLASTVPADVPIRTVRRTLINSAPRRRRVEPRSQVSRVVGGTVVVLATGAIAFVIAQLGLLGLIAATGAITLVVLLCCVRNRSIFFTLLTVLSLVLLLHKSIGPEDLQESGGAVAIYVTTFDAMIVLLYGLWIFEGTFGADVRAGLRRKTLLLPLIGLLFLLPSVLLAPSEGHALSEIVRMGWMYLLFFYAAVRIRTRQHVWAVLAGLAAFAFIEFVVVVLQWRTGGVLGLSFLGVPQGLTQRVTDTDSIGRPFGTIIHPVFMGAVMGSLALVALSLAISLRRSLTKIVAIAMIGVCTIPLYLSHTRASLIAALLAAVYVVGVGLRRGQLQWRTLRRMGVAVLVGIAVFWPQLQAKFSENFGTSHFWEEVQSRLQLNGIALNMINDHWGLGVGLNNFEIVLPRYEPTNTIFFGNPVHNVYLLYWAETGIIGLVGFSIVALGMLRGAFVATRTRDRLLSAVPVGVVGMMIFLGLEELLGFSVRQDVPLAVYWLLAGLALACGAIAKASPAGDDVEREPNPPNRPASVRQVRPATARAELNRAASGRTNGRSRNTPDVKSPRLQLIRRSWDRFGWQLRLLPTRLALVRARRTPSRVAPRRGAAVLAPVGVHRSGEVAVRRRGARVRLAAGLALLIVGFGVAGLSGSSSAANPSGDRIVFSADIHGTTQQAVFTVQTDGTDIERVTPDDGRIYSWPRWAFGNHKIVYTALRVTPSGPVDNIEMVNPDGTGRQVISSFDYVISQPLIDRTGRWLYFTAFTPWFTRVALFKMDLETLQSVNLTARTSPRAGLDADPVVRPDQQHVVVIAGKANDAEVDELSSDGFQRTVLIDDGSYNTDPDVSPDNRSLAVSSYRGHGTPRLTSGGSGSNVTKPFGFHIVTHRLGAHPGEQVLTKGRYCASREPGNPCTVPEMSGYLPRYFDDGRQLAFTGALDKRTSCICALNTDGSDPRVIVQSQLLAIGWFSFPQTHANSARIGDVGRHEPSSRVLLTAKTTRGRAHLYDASPDLMHRTELSLPHHLSPLQARWSPNRSAVVFTARVPIPTHQRAPHPAAPAGDRRREHVTLSDINPLSLALRTPTLRPRSLAREQVFLRSADGSVRPLTDPWIEDWRDGVRLGDARSNTDPSFTPDGRAVIVTNTSTLTGESFLLRIDLHSGRVLNLTNATSGAVPVNDVTPAVSPDGTHVAFATAVGRYTDLFTMDESSGRAVQQVTATDAPDSSPAWLPGGKAIVSLTERNGVRVVVATDVRTHRQTTLSGPFQGPATDPTPDPQGGHVIFVGPTITGSSAYTVATSGASVPLVLQPDTVHQFLYLDWR